MFSHKVSLSFLAIAVFSAFLSNNPALGKPSRQEARVSVELKEASKSLGDISFNHPYSIDANRLSAILSSLYFREKGVLKKRARKRIFLDKEVNALVPLILESLSKADPRKEVFATVISEKGLVRDKRSVFILFVLGKELNVAFSEVQHGVEEGPSFKDWKTMDTQDPVSLKKPGFWELVPGEGQRLMEGHLNWLVIDIEAKAFEPILIVEEEITPSSLLEERLRRLEEKVGISPKGEAKQEETKAAQPAPPQPPKEKGPAEKGLTEKFRELKALLNEELISQKDYEKKKQELLQEEPPKDKSVPEMLKELKELKDEGLITEADYEQWKARLLEKL